MELRLLWDIFRDRFWALCLCVAGSILAAFLIFAVSPTIYQGQADIQVKRTSETASNLSLIPSAMTDLNFVDKDNLMGSIDLFMRNDVLVRRVMDKCGISTNDFDHSPTKFADPGMLSILFRQRGVEIEAQKDSEVFFITGMAPDLEEAQKIANVFCSEFLDWYRELKINDLKKARENYVAQIKLTDAAVMEANDKELEYRKSVGLIDYASQKANILSQLKTAQDDLSTDMNTMAKVTTEKTANHPDVVILKASMANREAQIKDLNDQLNTLMDHENRRLEIVMHRDNLNTQNTSFDNAVREIDAEMQLDMSHFLVINPAIVGGDSDDYVYMPNKALILVVMLVLGVMAGVMLVFAIEYANESPRLFASFEQLAGDLRTISVRGRRGWAMILAELGRLKPGARIAILQRGGKRTHRFPAKLKRAASRSGTVQWTQVTSEGPSRGADSAIQPGDALKAHLASPASATPGSLSLYSFSSLTQSPDGYLNAASFDFVIYVARSGLANVEDIRADLRYMRAHGMADKMIGVFYDC